MQKAGVSDETRVLDGLRSGTRRHAAGPECDINDPITRGKYDVFTQKHV